MFLTLLGSIQRNVRFSAEIGIWFDRRVARLLSENIYIHVLVQSDCVRVKCFPTKALHSASFGMFFPWDVTCSIILRVLLSPILNQAEVRKEPTSCYPETTFHRSFEMPNRTQVVHLVSTLNNLSSPFSWKSFENYDEEVDTLKSFLYQVCKTSRVAPGSLHNHFI